jgi:transcriptional regulator with XRE-family HTH domain
MQDDSDNADSFFNKRFGDLMRAARDEKEWSQRRLAELLEGAGIRLDPSAITRIERGSRDVKLREATAIAHVLGIDLSDVLDEVAYSETQRFRIEVAAFVQAAIQARKTLADALYQLDRLIAVGVSGVGRDTVVKLVNESGHHGLPEFFAAAVRENPEWNEYWACYVGKEEREVLEATMFAITDNVLRESPL